MIDRLQAILRQFVAGSALRGRRWVRISLPRETWRFRSATAGSHHAWEVYHERNGRLVLLEAVTEDVEDTSRPLAEVHDDYRPFHAIDGTL